jgi:hypothetical protein
MKLSSLMIPALVLVYIPFLKPVGSISRRYLMQMIHQKQTSAESKNKDSQFEHVDDDVVVRGTSALDGKEFNWTF